MNISEIIEELQPKQVARAYYGGETCHVTNSNGFLRYCSADGSEIGETVPLTPSNIGAAYEIILWSKEKIAERVG